MTDPVPLTTAPFDDAEVESINLYQRSGVMHPFTCPCDDHVNTEVEQWDGSHMILVATEFGMECPDPACMYEQDWVHEFMAHFSEEMLKSFWPHADRQVWASTTSSTTPRPSS